MQKLFLTILVSALVFIIPDLLPTLTDSKTSAGSWLAVGGMRWFWSFRFLLAFFCFGGMPLKKWRIHREDATNLDILAFLLAVPMIFGTIRVHSKALALTGGEPFSLDIGLIFFIGLGWLIVDLLLAKLVSQYGLGNGRLLVLCCEVLRGSVSTLGNSLSLIFLLLNLCAAAFFLSSPKRIIVKRAEPERELSFALPRLVSGVLPLGFGIGLSQLPLAFLSALFAASLSEFTLSWIGLALAVLITIFGSFFYASLMQVAAASPLMQSSVDGQREGLRSLQRWERLSLGEALSCGLFFGGALILAKLLESRGAGPGLAGMIWLGFALGAIIRDWTRELSWFRGAESSVLVECETLIQSLDVQAELRAAVIPCCLKAQDSWTLYWEMAPFEHQPLFVREADFTIAEAWLAAIRKRWSSAVTKEETEIPKPAEPPACAEPQ